MSPASGPPSSFNQCGFTKPEKLRRASTTQSITSFCNKREGSSSNFLLELVPSLRRSCRDTCLHLSTSAQSHARGVGFRDAPEKQQCRRVQARAISKSCLVRVTRAACTRVKQGAVVTVITANTDCCATLDRLILSLTSDLKESLSASLLQGPLLSFRLMLSGLTVWFAASSAASCVSRFSNQT